MFVYYEGRVHCNLNNFVCNSLFLTHLWILHFMFLQSCYIFRSVSHRKVYKTSGSSSQNYIITTTQTTEESFLSDDYVTLTGDSNPSSCADFLADMFDRTSQVYHHHLRYMYEICRFHYNPYDGCCVKTEYKMYILRCILHLKLVTWCENWGYMMFCSLFPS
jgi:hypothetical protein